MLVTIKQYLYLNNTKAYTAIKISTVQKRIEQFDRQQTRK